MRSGTRPTLYDALLDLYMALAASLPTYTWYYITWKSGTICLLIIITKYYDIRFEHKDLSEFKFKAKESFYEMRRWYF